MIDIQKDTAVEGEEIEVNCTAMASKPATTIMWFKGDEELKGEAPAPCRRSQSAPHSSRACLWEAQTSAKHALKQEHPRRCGL